MVVDPPRSLGKLTIYPKPKCRHNCCQGEKPLAAIWRRRSGWEFPGIPWVNPVRHGGVARRRLPPNPAGAGAAGPRLRKHPPLLFPLGQEGPAWCPALSPGLPGSALSFFLPKMKRKPLTPPPSPTLLHPAKDLFFIFFFFSSFSRAALCTPKSPAAQAESFCSDGLPS